jgi:UPF0271 protein
LKGFVLDTSVLYYGKDLPPERELVITPGVVRELTKEGMAERLELLLATRVRVSSPSRKSLQRVREAAEKTGDSRRLSETDVELLALALELDYELLSDDYSIQNVASSMGITVLGMDQKGIRRIYEWDSRCLGCGKILPADVKECPVCGSETRSHRKRGSGPA